MERFGPNRVIMIKDSNPVDTSQLLPEKAYIQITYVEPYLETWEFRYRVTAYEQNNNIREFLSDVFPCDGAALVMHRISFSYMHVSFSVLTRTVTMVKTSSINLNY